MYTYDTAQIFLRNNVLLKLFGAALGLSHQNFKELTMMVFVLVLQSLSCEWWSGTIALVTPQPIQPIMPQATPPVPGSIFYWSRCGNVASESMAPVHKGSLKGHPQSKPKEWGSTVVSGRLDQLSSPTKLEGLGKSSSNHFKSVRKSQSLVQPTRPPTT